MPKNNLQILFNRLDRRFAAAEETFLHAEKLRHELKQDYASLLKSVTEVLNDTQRYPQSQLRKRLKLMENLLNDLKLRHNSEKRSFEALGFLMSRLRLRLASEMLEPRIYGKIRKALAEEEQLRTLREKYPDAAGVLTEPQKTNTARKKIRLLLIAVQGLHYAIPIAKIAKKSQGGPIAQKLADSGYEFLALPGAQTPTPLLIAVTDLAGRKKLIGCDEYFTPVEIPIHLLRKQIHYSPPLRSSTEFRPFVKFYGRRFFLYGARLSYTVRPGERKRPLAS